MRKIFLSLLSLVLVVNYGCSSNATKEAQEEKKPTRTFQLDYILQGAKTAEVPEWINEPQIWAKKNDKRDAKKFRYFVSTSEVIKNRRLCTKSAQVQATAAIASEITQFIKNSYGQSMHGEPNDDAEQYIEETLAQEVQSFLVGARIHRNYWEKRAYKTSLGAEEDRTGYVCSALVKMDRATIKKAIKRAQKKLLGNVRDTEAKKQVNDALKDASDKFDKLESPVKSN